MSTFKINKGVVDNLESSLSGKSSTDLDNLSQTGEAHFANSALSNSPYTTNRILEIPQNINLELVDGTLTLKAGSKVYVPNGFEEDGTTPKFDEVVIDSDKSTTGVSYSKPCFVLYDHVNKTISVRDILQCQSGTSTPSSAISGIYIYYNTLENKVYLYANNAWVARAIALPLCVVNMQTATPYITSIDQIFNGFGYIGSTIFALPGIKCLVGNGRNPDGSCITKIEASTKVSTFTVEGNRQNNKIVLHKGYVSIRASLWFDEQANMCFNNATGVSTYQPTAILGTFSTETFSPWSITNFNSLGVDSVANSNASNFSQAGKSYLSGLGMPSDRHIDLTLGASGSTYTAPANGWFDLRKSASSGQYIKMTGYLEACINSAGYIVSAFFPVIKGDVCKIDYTASGTTHVFRFIYAEGEE